MNTSQYASSEDRCDSGNPSVGRIADQILCLTNSFEKSILYKRPFPGMIKIYSEDGPEFFMFNAHDTEEHMAKLKKFMVVHRDMAISWDNVEKNWAKLAKVNDAKWIRTSFNKKKGIRYCLWESPSEKHLKEIFRNINSGWESILEVEETVPNQWGDN